MIRPYRPSDLDTLKEITAICFDGVAIDKNIEEQFGLIGAKDWKWRKLRHIDNDVAGENAESVFVFEADDGSYLFPDRRCVKLPSGKRNVVKPFGGLEFETRQTTQSPVGFQRGDRIASCLRVHSLFYRFSYLAKM